MSHRPIPANWRFVTFGEIVTFTKKPREIKYSDHAQIPFVPMALVPDDRLYFKRFNLIDSKELKSGTYFEAGDVLLAKITPSFENGKQGIVEALPLPFGLATTEVIPFNEVTNVSDKLYLFYYLLRKGVRAELAGKMQGTTGRQRLRKTSLQNLELWLPPIEEQKAITAVLRTTQNAISARQQEAALERERKAALMQHLFTQGTRGEELKETAVGKIPKSWQVVSLERAYRFTKKPRSLQYGDFEEVPFVPMELIPIGKPHFDDFILKSNENLTSGTYFEPGDVLLAKITPSFENGKQGVINELPTPFGIATTEVIPIQEIPNVSNRFFIFYYLLLSDIRNNLAAKMEGTTGRQRLKTRIIKRLQIPLPPIDEQDEITQILLTSDNKITALEKEIIILNELFQTLLEQLMTGQLST